MGLRCKIFGCRCKPAEDSVACWGECVHCGAIHGRCERTYIWRYIMAENAYKKAWQENTLPGMTL